MDRHEIRLHGKSLRGDRIQGSVVAALFPPLVSGAIQAVRLALEGRSHSPRGPKLDKLASFDLLPQATHRTGQFSFTIVDAALAERDPKLRQLELFDAASIGQKSGVALLEDFLENTLQDIENSEQYDHDLLATFIKLGAVFSLGVDRLELVNGRVVPYTAHDLDRMKSAAHRTPRPQHVRVAGKLDHLQHSTRRFTLELGDGTRIAGITEALPDETLRPLWGKNTVVEGMAFFKPSGRVRRIEATYVGPARDSDLQTFAEEPPPLFEEAPVTKHSVRTEPETNWLDKIWGKWPGNESDEEIEQLLEEFS